ncbi:RNA ligase (ATP), partial [Streptomyces sp. 2MCAF27]
MSTLRVTAELLTIHEHPNADALDLAQVGLYRAVVAKGAFRSGEFAVYVPEQAVLPDELIAELGLTGRLAGTAHNRVKAIRLRGELSQGLVCRPRALARVDLE